MSVGGAVQFSARFSIPPLADGVTVVVNQGVTIFMRSGQPAENQYPPYPEVGVLEGYLVEDFKVKEDRRLGGMAPFPPTMDGKNYTLFSARAIPYNANGHNFADVAGCKVLGYSYTSRMA